VRLLSRGTEGRYVEPTNTRNAPTTAIRVSRTAPETSFEPLVAGRAGAFVNGARRRDAVCLTLVPLRGGAAASEEGRRTAAAGCRFVVTTAGAADSSDSDTATEPSIAAD
jgi:hypothetical protein